MKLNLKIDAKVTEPEITIETHTLTDDIKSIIQCIEDTNCIHQLHGHHDHTVSLLKLEAITSIKAESKQVIALTKDAHYVIKSRLYTLEEELPSQFIRISKSELINLDKLVKLSMEPNGLIKMYLSHDYETYASRRYLKSIKERLEL